MEGYCAQTYENSIMEPNKEEGRGRGGNGNIIGRVNLFKSMYSIITMISPCIINI
jgi:hypothetical protein